MKLLNQLNLKPQNQQLTMSKLNNEWANVDAPEVKPSGRSFDRMIELTDYHKGFQPVGNDLLCKAPRIEESKLVLTDSAKAEKYHEAFIKHGLEVLEVSAVAKAAGYQVGDKVIPKPGAEPFQLPFLINGEVVLLVNTATVAGKYID